MFCCAPTLQSSDALDGRHRSTPIDPVGDIRFDEDYARFYELYSGQRKLPPPVEGRTLYQEVPSLFPNKLQAQQQAQLLAGAGLVRGGMNGHGGGELRATGGVVGWWGSKLAPKTHEFGAGSTHANFTWGPGSR